MIVLINKYLLIKKNNLFLDAIKTRFIFRYGVIQMFEKQRNMSAVDALNWSYDITENPNVRFRSFHIVSQIHRT